MAIGNCSKYLEETLPSETKKKASLYNEIRQKGMDIYTTNWSFTGWRHHRDEEHNFTAHFLLKDAERKVEDGNVIPREEDYEVLENLKPLEHNYLTNDRLPIKDIKRRFVKISPVTELSLSVGALEELTQTGYTVSGG